MLKNRLAPYIFVSVMIHTGLLFGMHRFLRLPDAQLEPQVLIPVEMVVLREQPPDPALRITASEPMATKKQDATVRSQLAAAMAAAQGSDEIADPVPAQGNFQPSVNLETNDLIRVIRMASERQKLAGQLEMTLSQTPPLHLSLPDKQINEVPPSPKEGESAPRLPAGTMPTPSTTSTTAKGDEAASEPMIPAIQVTAMDLSPVEPSSPAGSTPVDISTSADLVEAKAALSPPISQKGKEVASEPVILALQMTAMDLSPAQPSPPAGSTPVDISTSADLVEAKAAVSPPISRRVKEVASEPVDLSIQKTTLKLSPVEPSSPAGSSPLDIRTSADLAEADAAVSPHFSQASHQAVTSLADIQAGDDFVSELRPIVTASNYTPSSIFSTFQTESQRIGGQIYVVERLEGEFVIQVELNLPLQAKIYVDDILLGKTPQFLKLPPGKYLVVLALPDYYEWEGQIELSEEREKFLSSIQMIRVEEKKE